MEGTYVITNPDAGKHVYLRKVEMTKPYNWEGSGGFCIMRTPEKRKKARRTTGELVTAEYTTEIRKAKRFESLEAAEKYIQEYHVLRHCRIARGEKE